MTAILDTREYAIQSSDNNGETWRHCPGHSYVSPLQATSAATTLAGDKRNSQQTFRVIEVRQTWTVVADITRTNPSPNGKRQAQCPTHRVNLTPGLTVPKCPVVYGIAEYGVFGDEGSLEAHDCAYSAANRAAEYAAEDPDTQYTVRRLCNDHRDNAADTCEDCG